jgi:predicted TIM-barrel enzyme
MPPPASNSRAKILARLRAKVAKGQPIIGGGAGTGLSAKCEEAGGIDLIVIYNSGRYRMAGRGSLSGLMPYGNANQIVKEMAYEVLPVVKNTPVLAGVCGTDPFMLPKQFLSELKELGFAGIQNFPTVGLVDGKLRQNLEETGISYKQEVEVVALAHEMDLLTTPYVFDEQETKWMTDAGADILVAHMGCTTGGTMHGGGALAVGGATGNGWVGDARSPGTSLWGTLRSSTPKIGLPVSRSSRKRLPVLEPTAIAGSVLPLRRTENRSGGEATS